MEKLTLKTDSNGVALLIARPEGGADLEQNLTGGLSSGAIDCKNYEVISISPVYDVFIKIGDSEVDPASLSDYDIKISSGETVAIDHGGEKMGYIRIYSGSTGKVYINGWV